MRLSDLNKLIFFLNIFFNFNHLMAENEIDIWKKSNSNNSKTNIESSEKKKFRVP